MSFAERYIQRNIVYSPFVNQPPCRNLGMVVVITVYNEPELLKTMDSLAKCQAPKCSVEVLLVINSGVNSPDSVSRQNQQTAEQVCLWSEQDQERFFTVSVLLPSPFIKKHAGAGMARKVGMDEAVRRFAMVDNPGGIIVSLDADTLVDASYMVEIEKHFSKNTGDVGACIKFEHRVNEVQNERHREGILLYEKYLHYYRDALAYTGYPHAIHTVGSAFAVKVDAYIRQGGMNRKQAGEDFYFLHKLIQAGPIGEIHSTCVYPSARISDRVPFGTGPVLQKWLDGDKSLTQTYRFNAFIDLKMFFELVPSFFELPIDSCVNEAGKLALPLINFLEEDGFWSALSEIKSNSSRPDSFKKRFFQYFNAFKVLKFMNYLHPKYYSFQDLVEADQELRENF